MERISVSQSEPQAHISIAQQSSVRLRSRKVMTWCKNTESSDPCKDIKITSNNNKYTKGLIPWRVESYHNKLLKV